LLRARRLAGYLIEANPQPLLAKPVQDIRGTDGDGASLGCEATESKL
jgi:hypothetical protein